MLEALAWIGVIVFVLVLIFGTTVMMISDTEFFRAIDEKIARKIRGDSDE